MSTKKPLLSAGRPSTKNKMADKEPKVRIKVELPAAARTKLKMHALKSGKTITQLIGAYIDTLPG